MTTIDFAIVWAGLSFFGLGCGFVIYFGKQHTWHQKALGVCVEWFLSGAAAVYSYDLFKEWMAS